MRGPDGSTGSWEFYDPEKNLLAIVFNAVTAFYLYMTLNNAGQVIHVKENKPY